VPSSWPVLQAVLPVRQSQVPRDLLAGVTLAALAIPQALGYAKIAGMPVVTGLYTMLLPMAAFAVLGSSRHLVVAADSATAALLAAALTGLAAPGSPAYVHLAGLAALLTGGLLLLARLARLGFLANFLSRTVLTGFLAGVGIQVAATASWSSRHPATGTPSRYGPAREPKTAWPSTGSAPTSTTPTRHGWPTTSGRSPAREARYGGWSWTARPSATSITPPGPSSSRSSSSFTSGTSASLSPVCSARYAASLTGTVSADPAARTPISRPPARRWRLSTPSRPRQRPARASDR